MYVGNDFYSYSSGYFDCADTATVTGVNHAVTIIGYGMSDVVPATATTPEIPASKYFIIKNSWGSWGEAGYWRVKS